MAKVVIIGGGVAGLAAGIYARKSGYDCEIYEKHFITGGQCTGWNRGGYHIDNCVHWLTGTSPDTDIHRVWREVGVLADDIDIISHKLFLQVRQDGKVLNVWSDLDRFADEMTAIAPEDRRQIRHFVKMLKAFSHMDMPALKPAEQMTFADKMRFLRKCWRLIPYAVRYNGVSLPDYVSRFRSSVVRAIISSYLPATFNVISIVYMYATFLSGNGAMPRGGSMALTKRMETRFRQLGGKVFTRHEAKQVGIEGSRLRSVTFADGTTVEADNFIFACDTRVTFGMLGDKYMDNFFRKRYADIDTYPVFSNFNVYLAADSRCEDLPDMLIFSCRPFSIVGRDHDRIVLKNFNYEPSFAPEGHTVLQVLMVQDAADFDRWQHLYTTDREAYRAEKAQAAAAIVERIVELEPHYAGHLKVIETVSPYSFHRYCGAYKGAYMSFISTHKTERELHNGRVAGLDNVYLSGQWIQPPGGLPNALVSGRFAVQRMCKVDGTEFVSDCK